MPRSKKIARREMRAALRELSAYDKASMLLFLSPKKLVGEMKVTKAIRRSPLILPLPPDTRKVKEYCLAGAEQLNIITVAVHMLHGDPYRVAMGENSSSTVQAAEVLGVPVPISYAGQYLCEPEAFTLRTDHDLWSLVSDEFSDIRPWNFGNDAIAQALLALGVKEGK